MRAEVVRFRTASVQKSCDAEDGRSTQSAGTILTTIDSRPEAERLVDQGHLPDHGVSGPSFFTWRKKLALTERSQAQGDFVTVRVAPKPIVRSDNIEIVLDRGRIVRVAPCFGSQILREALAVLDERTC